MAGFSTSEVPASVQAACLYDTSREPAAQCVTFSVGCILFQVFATEQEDADSRWTMRLGWRRRGCTRRPCCRSPRPARGLGGRPRSCSASGTGKPWPDGWVRGSSSSLRRRTSGHTQASGGAWRGCRWPGPRGGCQAAPVSFHRQACPLENRILVVTCGSPWCQAARAYRLIRPPMTGFRWIGPRSRSATVRWPPSCSPRGRAGRCPGVAGPRCSAPGIRPACWRRCASPRISTRSRSSRRRVPTRRSQMHSCAEPGRRCA